METDKTYITLTYIILHEIEMYFEKRIIVYGF
jgi:putative transposon-encoded protein